MHGNCRLILSHFFVKLSEAIKIEIKHISTSMQVNFMLNNLVL